MAEALPFVVDSAGITLTVRVTPRAARTGPAGTFALPDGRVALAFRLAAPPVDGAANEELVRALSRLFSVPRRAVELAAGDTARLKRIRVSGEAEALAATARQLATQE